MEKDSRKEVSKPDDTSDWNAKDEEWALIEEQMLLEAQQQSLQEHLNKLIEKTDQNERRIASLKRTAFPDDKSQFQTSPFDSNVYPVAEPLHKSQFSSDSTNLTRRSVQTNINFSENIKYLTDHSDIFSKSLKCLNEKVDNLKNLLSKQRDNETQTSGSLDSQSNFEIKDNTEEPRICYNGKGKEASNPKFRYKKGSRNVPSCVSPGKEAHKPTNESDEQSGKNVLSWSLLAKDSPRAQSEEVSSTSEPKSPQESKVQVKNVLGMKRKSLAMQQLDEIGPSTSGVSQNLSDDDDEALTIAKRRKSDDGEKPSDSCPTLAGLLANIKHESLPLEQFMHFEELNEPSTSHSPKSEGSYSENGSDIAEFGDRDASPYRSEGSMSPVEGFFTSGYPTVPVVMEDAVQKCGDYFLHLIQFEDKSNKDDSKVAKTDDDDDDSNVTKTDDEASPSNT